MTDTYLYTFPSPLEGYSNLEPLPTEISSDGKSLVNPPSSIRSTAYDAFTDPITNGIRAGFDIHIYFLQTNEEETTFAKALHERIRREFPELRIYKVFERPVGPHPVGMFEVNIHTPEQFGAFVPWLVVHRGPLSALVHPNTGDDVRDHTQRATWMGTPYPLAIKTMREYLQRQDAEAAAAALQSEKTTAATDVNEDRGPVAKV